MQENNQKLNRKNKKKKRLEIKSNLFFIVINHTTSLISD